MLLIRGVRTEEHAKLINKGIVGCRDVASTLLKGVGNTGYANSNYHEQLFCQTAFAKQGRLPLVNVLPKGWANVIRIALDLLSKESYMTYFHIVEEDVTERWLSKSWPDGGYFIYYEPRFDLPGLECICGDGYCGTRVEYVTCAEDIDPRKTIARMPSLARLIEREIGSDMGERQREKYLFDCFTLLAPLFNRIQTPDFSSEENEFRVLVRTARTVFSDKIQFPQKCAMRIKCKTGSYELLPKSMESSGGLNDVPLIFRDGAGNLREFEDIFDAADEPEIMSTFIDLDIRDTALRYGYVGNEEDCKKFVRDELSGISHEPDGINHHRSTFAAEREPRLIRLIRSYDEVEGVIRLPVEGCYSMVGPGYKELNLPNPLELGLSNPQDSFLSALQFLVGTESPSDSRAFNSDVSRAFLLSSLEPWLPMRLYRIVGSDNLRKELGNIKFSGVPLRCFGNCSDVPEFRSFFREDAICSRMNESLTEENLRSYLEALASREDSPLDSTGIAVLSESMFSDFANSKARMIEDVVSGVRKSFPIFLDCIHAAEFLELCDEEVQGLSSDLNGIILEYVIDPETVECVCSCRTQCERNLLFMLSPVLEDLDIDLSKFSYGIAPAIEYNDEARGAQFSIMQALVACASAKSESMRWRLNCFACEDAGEGMLFANLRPISITLGEALCDADRELVSKIVEELNRLADASA